MLVERRTFLIGLAALVASPAIARAELFTGPIAVGTLPSPLKWRNVKDFTVSSMDETGRDETIHYTWYRDDEPVHAISMNARAMMRWVSLPDGGIVVPERSVLRLIVEPCLSVTTLSMQCDIEKDWQPHIRRRMFTEVHRWNDNKSLLDHVAACDPERDGHVLKGTKYANG